MLNEYENKIEAILFDMMGVLLFVKKKYKPDLLVDEIDNLIGKVTNDIDFKAQILNRYKFTETEFNKILVKIADKYEPFKPLWDLMPKLKKKYKLAIINNGTSLTLSYFDKKLHFKNYFDLFISSAIECIKKPDKEIFLLAAERLNVLPENCLFMDDSEENINGAKSVGMRTILWKNKDQVYKEFTEFINL